MKKISVSVCLCTLVLLLGLAGCGGGDSDSTIDPVVISGVVEDGPIENATISLRDKLNVPLALCGPQWTAPCEAKTNAGGAYTFTAKAGTDLTDLSVVAVGGRDLTTGVDFTGLEMRTPLALFESDVTEVVTSPLTTLVAELHAQGGLNLEIAQQRVRDWLALPVSTKLAVRPTENLDLQRRTLLLSKIALELNTASPAANPFSAIAEKIAANTMLLATEATCNLDVLNAFDLTPDAQARVAELQTRLAAASTIAGAVAIFKNKELMDIFAANVEQMLMDSSSFDPKNPVYLENLRLLAETTLQAAGSEVIPLGGTIPQRLARYILFTYNLRTWESLITDSSTFADSLQLAGVFLASDPWVAEMVRSRSLYSVVSPLLLTELPGHDNQQRLAYYYGSDLSPHYQAEQLIGRVFDDAINDAVLLKIIEGKATAGLIDETRTIIATQIVQSEPKAHAYRAVANALLKFNRPQEALESLDLARDLYRQVIVAHKGAALTITTDVTNLLATASSYRKAGDLRNAESLLKDVADIATSLSTTSALIYGNLITGFKNVADDYIAAGDFDAASPLVEAMDNCSALTPAYAAPSSPLLSTYKLRIFNWSETAKRYADLDNSTKVVEVFSNIQDLRKVEGSAEALYWTPIISLVEALYRVGQTTMAFDLANTIPNGSVDQVKAFKLVVVYEALQEAHLQNAFTIADNVIFFPKDEDKFDLLTYFAANRKNPGIALALITAGSFSDARLALEKAEVLLEGMTQSNNLVRISNGYVKVAELYALMGENAKAAKLLERAQAKIVDDVYRITAMADIALGYHNLNQTDAALTLLDSGKNLADADPTRFRVNPTLNLGKEEYAAQLYEKLIKAYEQVGDKGRVRTATLSLQAWAQKIHTAGTVADKLAIKECVYLLRAALYLEHAAYHDEALDALNSAKEITVGRVENGVMVYDIVVAKDRLENGLSVITTYAVVHEYEKALALALSLEYTTERNQAIQSLANAYIDRDDFLTSAVASIDSDGDGQSDFFHPLANAEEIAASGLLLDDDSDGDGIVDTMDLRPLFADK